MKYTIKHPIGTVELTEKECLDFWRALEILQNAILVLINEENATKSWDIPYHDKEEAIEAVYQVFNNPTHGWNPDFIKAIFNR